MSFITNAASFLHRSPSPRPGRIRLPMLSGGSASLHRRLISGTPSAFIRDHANRIMRLYKSDGRVSDAVRVVEDEPLKSY
ncbi:MAG: hypothetical protein JWL90_2037 [Chthoniobacteraceae bacterium]|nr:hypothetical protein [Chthoniobacteraceae bacterium]